MNPLRTQFLTPVLKFVLAVCFTVFSSQAFACVGITPTFTTSTTTVCGPVATVITLTNTSTGVNAATSTYTWFHNGVMFDNTTGLAAPSTFTVSTLGAHVFAMEVDNGAGCTDTAYVTVNVVPVPNASFTFTPNNACAGTNVAFTNTSTGVFAGTTYSWNFGDGTPVSTATNPTHAFAAGGTYNVTLTMTNGAGCTSTFTLPVTALAIPLAAIGGDDGDGNTTYCLLPGDGTTSETVTFSNFTTGAVSYLWDFGDGSPTSTAFAPSHLYSSFGTFNVTMTATGANGCTSTTTLTVVFEKYVSAGLTLSVLEYSGCVPHTLSTLTNLSVNANTYTWNFGDGSPAVVTTSPVPPSHTYVTGGTYTITLTASNSCNTASATISPITIINGPTAGFVPSTTLGCAPQNISFVNTSTGTVPANNYQWNMGNGNTYTNITTPPVQNYPTQGTYTVTLIAGNACGHDTITTTIVIDSIPVADITSTPLVGCSPLTVSTTNNSYGNSITYQWFVDGVLVSTAANLPNQTFTAPPGNVAVTHTISLTVTNHCGSDTDAETITVHPAVVAQFTPVTATICEGASVTFTNTSLGDMLTYNWDFGDGTTSTLAGPHTHTYNTAGTYVVSLTVTGFCGTSTITHTVTVNPYPVAAFTPLPVSGCAPLVVNFTNTSTPGATSYTWAFGTGSAPATSTAYNPPAVTYSTPGTSNVTLTVNALGCISTTTATITINPIPVPAFTIVPNNGCSPLAVTFNNTSAVTAGDMYAWNFGNGTTSSLQNPPGLTYTNSGIIDSVYSVTLTITTANGCVATATQTVTVHPLPVADFTALPDTVCATTPVAFLNNSTGASTYSWNFGDGSAITTVMSPAHAFTTQGLYTVTLIATTAFGCKDTMQHNVFVDPIPNSSFSFSTECVGDSTQFTDLSTGAVTNWAWNFGDGGTSTSISPAHLYASAGTYNTSLTVTNTAGCTHTSNQLVTVNAVPVAGIGFTSTCLGTTTNFTNASTGISVAWNWDFGDGGTSTLQNPGHVYAAVGTYTVQLIAFGGSGCADTATITVTVTPIPTADFTFTEVCAGDLTVFSSTSLGAPDTFDWTFGDGGTDNTDNPNPSHTYAVAGTYNVTLTAGYAASGCTNSITYAVDANPRTVPNFTNNTPCFGAPTNFTDLTTNAPITWEWNFGDGSAADFTQNPSHTYSTPGFYTVSLITSNAFTCVDTFTATIQVFALPVAGYTFDTICETFATTFTDASSFSALWSWDFGDGSPLSNASSPTHVFPAAGTYTVQQIVTNAVGCTDTSIQTVTVNPNPVAAFNASTACHTYPNTFTDLSTGAVTWEWDFGDGSALDFTQNPLHVYPIDGTYSVELEVTNIFGCSDSITQNALVLLQPQSAFTNSTVCAKQPVSFTDNTTGAPSTWNWDFGDGGTSTLQNPTHTYLLGGTYTITLITGNMAGCLDTLTQTINVFTVPVPDFTADTACLFNITHFTDLSTDGVAITSWYWDFGDGNNSFSSNPNYIYMAPGVYNVTLTVTNANGCDSTITKQVVVNDIPVAAFTADTACVGSPTNFTDISTGAPVTWLWDFGDGTTSTTGPTVSHTYAAAGTFIVQLYVTGGTGTCFDQTFGTVTVSNTVTAYFNDEDTACVNEVITFTDSSNTTGPPITTWNWNFGDGATSTSQNTSHAFSGPGNYLVTLSIAVGGGCNSSHSQNVLVVNDPSANFALGDGCLNQTSTFNSTSLGNGLPIATTQWYFGDGSTATGTPATHVYNPEGTYAVSLVVTGISGCKDSVSYPITVHPLPVAAFSNNSVCLNDTVFFNDLSTIASGAIVNWTWDFGDGAGSNVQETNHVYTAQNDTFPVTLIVESDFGCLDTVTQNAVLHPIVNFDFGTDNANGCAPYQLPFTDNSTAAPSTIVGWVWNFDDGLFSFQQNPIHGFVNDGQYYVSLTVTTSDGCVFTDTLDYPVTVYPQPVAGFNADPVTTSIYQPEIQFQDLSMDAVFYEWDFGDFNHSNLANPEHYYTTTGTFNVMQIVTNNYGCSDTAIHPIIILEEPTFYAPNAVTPDGDGLNEVFQPMAYGLTDYHLYIFDRWGELLFETTDITQPWDCTYKGQLVKHDVYVWRVILHTITGDAQEHRGHVTVVR